MSLDRAKNGACRVTRRELARHADEDGGDLSGAALDHLRACAACRERAEDLHEVRAGLQALPLVPMPAARLAAILAHTAGPAPRPWLRRWLPGALGAAAAIVL